MNDIFRQIFASLPTFQGFDWKQAVSTLDDASWYSVPGGWCLFDVHEPADALFIVVSGTLIVTREYPDGLFDAVGYVRAGEPVGEMALILDSPHSASAYALRDTEVLRIEKNAFNQLWTDNPTFAQALSRSMVLRERERALGLRGSRPKVFALLATSPSIDVNYYAEQLSDAVNATGQKCATLIDQKKLYATSEFENMEQSHDVVLVPTRLENSPWFRLAIRQADRIFVLARADARPSRPMPLLPSQTENSRRFGLVDLILLGLGAHKATPTLDWADAVGANRIFHWKSPNDAERIARTIMGKSVGVVLSGGGARAYAHIGALQALKEYGIQFDFIGGTSMGAVIGACFAMGWPESEIDDRIRDGFVVSNPLGDFSLPVMALTKGVRVDERLRHHFGDVLIEDMPVPFYCVSTALKLGRDFVHKSGRLRTALRASISLPGVLPPVSIGDDVHVDGAVVNNLPTDIMARQHRGRTIAVDVARRNEFCADDFSERQSFFHWVSSNGFRSAPPIVDLLMRTATLSRDPDKGYEHADFVVTPIIEGVELRDWKAYDTAVAAGYEATVKALQRDPWNKTD